MKKIVILPVLALFFLSLGCKRNEQQNAQQNNSAKDPMQQGPQGDKEAAANLVLNNGRKWQSNPETSEGIRKMRDLTDDYLSKGRTDNKILAENLEKEFTGIIQKCTMSGMAHEQLHLFLLPLKAKIDHLKENQQRNAAEEIQSYLKEYDTYFQ